MTGADKLTDNPGSPGTVVADKDTIVRRGRPFVRRMLIVTGLHPMAEKIDKNDPRFTRTVVALRVACKNCLKNNPDFACAGVDVVPSEPSLAATTLVPDRLTPGPQVNVYVDSRARVDCPAVDPNKEHAKSAAGVPQDGLDVVLTKLVRVA